MNLKKKWFLTSLLVLFLQVTFSQTIPVKGTITDGGFPLPGASVVIKGTSTGTQSNLDGNYTLNVEKGQTLVFSFIGMESKEVVFTNNSTINVEMEANATILEGVVIEGYKETTKVKSANAVVTLSAEAIEDRPNANFMQSIQGQVSGLQITTSSGQPGANSNVVLRGRGSLSGNVEPLYVIDGIQMNTDDFRNIDPNEIESISVLKDAGATAIYGNRGGNGVIIVTTKLAKFNQRLKTNYTVTSGISFLQDNKFRMANTQEMLQIERNYGVGMGRTMTDSQILDTHNAHNTDWKKYFFRTGVNQSHNLNFSMGGENSTNFTSINYFHQDGILRETGMNRFNLRNNMTGKSANGKFKYGLNFAASYTANKIQSNAGGSNVNSNPLMGSNFAKPYYYPEMYKGAQSVLDFATQNGTFLTTPFSLMNRLEATKDRADEFKLLASFNMSYNITDDLSIKTQLGIDYTTINTLFWESPESYLSLSRKISNAGVHPDYPGGYESQINSRDVYITSTSSINYSKTFNDKHNLNVRGYLEFYKAHYRGGQYSKEGMDPLYAQAGSSAGWVSFDPTYPTVLVPYVNSSKFDASLVSVFANADYDFNDKYGFDATVRRDGSYRFVDKNKWGTFWSVAGRWNISQEAFMNSTSNWLSLLKLRASYGTNGNQLIAGQSIYNGANLYSDIASSYAGYLGNPSIFFSQLGNESLRWEEIKQLNVGLDFALFKNRLVGTFDIYQKRTDNLYLQTPIEITTGFNSIYSNYGSLQNRGAELYLNYHLVKNSNKGLNVKINFNGAYNKNKVLDIPSESGVMFVNDYTVNRVGKKMYEIYTFEYAGVNPVTGNLLFNDKNGQLTENPTSEDRKYTGKSAYNPKFQGGFGFDIDYKNFFLNTLFTYVTDVYRLNSDLGYALDPSYIASFNTSRDLLDAWTPDNRYTNVPSLTASNLSIGGNSDRYLENASYLRLKSIMLGYNFDKNLLKQIHISNLRLYAQAENLITWSKWRGWDAESNRITDVWQYPTPRIITFGVQIGL